VDKAGLTVDFFLSRNRDVNAAKTFLRSAMKNTHKPTKIIRTALEAPGQDNKQLPLVLFPDGGLPKRPADFRAGRANRSEITGRHEFLRGPDLKRNGALPSDWKLARDPSLLETSVPGVFAAGDVRRGSVKRVASGVGEGSIAIQFIHQHLADR
jgi:hypothetical protein